MAEQTKTISREKTIVRTGIIGIIANILLASFKALIGLTVHSTAMVLDAVNNFSDVLSSVVTIIGTKIASRKPDYKHPLGHGRVEYLAQMIIAALILYAGITALWESIQKIINPVEADHSAISLTIISVAIVVKIGLGIFVKGQGKKVKSDLLISSGTDALFDAILSTAVLISAVILLLFKFNIEAYVSVIISLFILKCLLIKITRHIRTNPLKRAHQIPFSIALTSENKLRYNHVIRKCLSLHIFNICNTTYPQTQIINLNRIGIKLL